uniref:Uncharacterized protein n=1 Tax=Ditylenchus dipsaci TaxID=166011 RepID=A0A915E5P7_9BILA
MNANGSNPNTNNQPQLSNAYAQQQPPPNAVNSHVPATLVLPQDTVIQMTRQGNGHQFVQATFQRPEQTTGYPPVNYPTAVNPYYQGQYAYPQVYSNNMAAQQQFLAQQAVVQNFHQQQQQQQHHPQHQQHYSQQQQQQPPTQVPMSQQQQQPQQQPIAVVAPQQQTILNPPMPQKPKRVLTIVDPSTNTVINDEQVRETVQAASKSNASAAASIGEESTAAATTAAAIQNNFTKLHTCGTRDTGADTNSTTTTTTTTTVEAAPGGGAHTESTKSKEAATDENEPILSGAAQLRSSSIGVVQQQQKAQQLVRSGSAPKEVDSADIQALTTAFKEKLHTQSPQATPSPPFTAPSSAQAHSSSVSREGSRGPIVITADVIKEEHYGKSDRQSVENGGTSSPSIVISGDHRGSLQDSSQYSFQKHRSPSHDAGGEEAHSENGKHGDDSPLENGLSEPLAETEDVRVFKDPEEANKISSQVYSSNFLHLMRNFIRELRHVRCPKTEAELQEMGIDLAGMPANAISTKTGGTGGTLNPRMSGAIDHRLTWVVVVKDVEAVLATKLSLGEIPCSQTRDQTSLHCQNEETMLGNQRRRPRKARMKTRLGTIMSRKRSEFAEQDHPIHLRGHGPTVLRLQSPHRSQIAAYDHYLDLRESSGRAKVLPLYSDLCLKQVELENKIAPEQRPPTSFRSSIITKCQETFLGATSSDDLIKQLEEERANEETEDSKKSAITEKIDLLKSKEKRRLLGIIKFIAQLYRHSLLIDMIINCLASRKKQETAVTSTTPTPAADAEVPPIEKIVAHLSSIKASLTNRVKFMIMNLEDLRKNNWQAKHGNTGPKTLKDIKDEAEQEQLENEQDRAAYDRKKALTSDFNNKKGGRSNYPGRGSIENNNSRPVPQSTDRRAAAAQASSQTGTASVRKDTNLNKVDDGRLGRRPTFGRAPQRQTLALVL